MVSQEQNDLLKADLEVKIQLIRDIIKADGKIILINALWLSSIIMAIPLVLTALIFKQFSQELVPLLSLDAITVILTSLYRISKRFKYDDSDSNNSE